MNYYPRVLITLGFLTFFALPAFGQVIFEEPQESIETNSELPAPRSPSNPLENPPLTNPPFLAQPKLPDETDRISSILNFWFGDLPDPSYFPQDKVPIWFSATPEIDRQIRENFLHDVELAGSGNLNSWRSTARGRLALVLLLDQFPRRIWRNETRAYMLDRMARALVFEGIQKGDDKELYPIERAFFYLPLEHSEDLEMQNLSVSLYRSLVGLTPEELRPVMNQFLQSAIMHRELIDKFGRFPYRNELFDRQSTQEELLFLRQRKNSV